jgi:hypothetical protein
MELKMFMWEWQHVFQEAISNLLANTLNILKVSLKTNVFVIGIPIPDPSINYIYFHPEDCGYFPQEFQTVFSITDDYYESDPRRNTFHTVAHVHESVQNSLYPKALNKAIESILDKHSSAKRLVSFCSFPVRINCHWVTIVIQIDKDEWDVKYRLIKLVAKQSEYHQYRLDRSFLEAIIYAIFSTGIKELESPSRGNCWELARTERVLEDAALGLLSSVKMRVNPWGNNLFELANAVSAERYEGSGSKGRLVICSRNNPCISVTINLKDSIRINNYRGIRKLIEISSKTMALLCDGTVVWGLGHLLDTYDPCNENIFEIEFIDHYTWELTHDKQVMLNVKYRQPKLPIERFDKSLFCDHIIRLFNVDEEETLTILVESVEAAVEQRHGTMLVITSKAETEAKRLRAQSTVIEPISVSGDIISHISSVDGAILISPNGIIHAFGVILDGVVSENGDPSRGARFNSAIRYVDGKKANDRTNCLALIVSEDGYVNLYPTLRPRILRSLIDELIKDIEKHADKSQAFDYEKARSSMWNLEDVWKYGEYKIVKRACVA